MNTSPSHFTAALVAAGLLLGTLAGCGADGDAPPADAAAPASWPEGGMPVWDEARRTEAGSFSGVVETPGAWTFVHVLAVGAEPGEAFGPMTQVTVQRYDVPYIEREATRDMLQSAMDQLELEIVDPEWEKVVPASLLYPRTPTGG